MRGIMEHFFPKKIVMVILTPFIVVSMLMFWFITQYLAENPVHPAVFVVITTMVIIGIMMALFQ
jgi:hypothetical protein